MPHVSAASLVPHVSAASAAVPHLRYKVVCKLNVIDYFRIIRHPAPIPNPSLPDFVWPYAAREARGAAASMGGNFNDH